MSLPGRMLLVVGCHYQVGCCLWWGVVTRTRWNVACGGVSIAGCCLWWEVITRWDVACGGVLLPGLGGTLLVMGCQY